MGVPSLVAAQSAGAILPALGSAPETGLQYGLAYLRAWQPDDTLGTRPSSRMGNAIYTAERQFRSFFESDRWSPGNERRRQWGVIAMAYPLLLLDLSMPRNIDPALAGVPGVTIADLDALHIPVLAAEELHKAAVPAAEAIVEAELESFVEWVSAAAARSPSRPARPCTLSP